MDNNIELRDTTTEVSLNGVSNERMESDVVTVDTGHHQTLNHHCDKYAVLARNAEKSYRRFVIKKGRQILRRLNLSVKKSSVYALLGPSGCGKTTLLRCVIGQLALDSGFILVFGHLPGTVESGIPGKRLGYMPQDIALYKELTVNENLQYFGKAFGMKNKEVERKTQFLLDFLELPDKNQMLATLSGGQQRRVSFATALLHNPELLIVDEPTVGVDSILRKRIWEYLHTLAATEKNTIIITTHYIEEARKADTVGMMHDGVVISESSPELAMAKFNCNTLEGVFLQLCILYENSKDPKENSNSLVHRNETKDNYSNVNGHEHVTDALIDSDDIIVTEVPKFSMKVKSLALSLLDPPRYDRIYAATLKNLRRTYRDYKIAAMQVVVPVLLLTAYALAFTNLPMDLPLGIVNQDELDLGTSFLTYIDKKHVIQTPFPTFEEAEAAVASGSTWGSMLIGPNFTEAFMTRFLHGPYADNQTISQSTIKVSLDLTNQVIAMTIFKTINFGFQEFGREFLTRAGLEAALADIPIEINEKIYGEEERTYMDFAAPGLILSTVYFISICLTILSFFMERVAGQIERSSVAGITAMEITIGFILSCFTMMAIQTATLLVVTILILGVMCRGSVFLVSLLTIGQGLCGMTYGLVISAVCDSEYTAAMLALGGFLPNMCLSGIFWPLEGMPPVLREMTKFLPQTYAVTGLRDIMGRGWGITYETVYLGFTVTLLWTGVFFVSAAAILRLKG